MSKNTELIREMPPRNDIKMDELISAMRQFGFLVRFAKGSHVIFKHPIKTYLYTVVPIPHGGSNCVKVIYIKKIQSLLRELLD